jgi:chromosome segregation ATPase
MYSIAMVIDLVSQEETHSHHQLILHIYLTLLQETGDQHREVCERLEQEKQELQARLQEQLEAERALQLRLEALQVDGDVTQKQLAALQSHIHSLQPSNNIDSKIDLDSFKSTDSTGEIPFPRFQLG